MKLAKLPIPLPKSTWINFQGGNDRETAPAMIPPGFLSFSENWEMAINGAYQTLTGYERFDGSPSPNNAKIFVLPIVANITKATWDSTAWDTLKAKWDSAPVNYASTPIPAGTVVTGASSGATATVLAMLPGQLIVTGLAGTFTSESIGFGAAVAGNPTGVTGTPEQIANYQAQAVALLSQAIGTVPGQGPVLGVWYYKNKVYAFRNQSVGVGMYASSPTGWASVATLPNQNGRFEFVNATFTGSFNDFKMYGCDGQNNAFEYDGTTFKAITTPLDSTLKPSHLAAHQNQLFLSYSSSVINSKLGDPFTWATTSGTAELACMDRVTGFMVQPGEMNNPALAIFCRNRTWVLYGTSAADFQLVDFNSEQGAIDYTIQKIHQTYLLDDRGITSLGQAQEFGNFAEATLSFRMKQWLAQRRSRVTDSHISRDKQQYRLFFSDGTGLYCRIDSQEFSMMPVRFPRPVLCSVSAETFGGGDELVFFGSDDGYVYQMERGSSFAGKPISTELVTVYNHAGSYHAKKKYRRATFEMVGAGHHRYQFSYRLSFYNVDASQPDPLAELVNLTIAKWDTGTWDELSWDGDPQLLLKTYAINGDGHNIALRLTSSGDNFTPLKISGCLLEYSLLRQSR